ncbi:MAG: clostripain-related cysteine peptidase [Chloroflexia bacterium]
MVRRYGFRFFCAALLIGLLLSGIGLLPARSAPSPQTAQWTFIVYMAADNNLEGAGIDDFLEMAAAGSDANLHIVVQFDRIPGYDSSYGNWTSTKRFHITSGMTPDPANGIDIGEANMGDPQTAIDFIQWARANYPAEHYALIWWNHGGGWLSDFSPHDAGIEDFCWDDTNGGDALTSAELYQVLDTVTAGGSQPIDLVGFDACLMAMWEVDNQIKPFASAVSVSSEETEPFDGWPYDTILNDLKANPTWSPAQLGADIVQRYYESYGNDETQSAKDLGNTYTALNLAVDGFARALILFEPLYHDRYDTARDTAQSFGGSFIDVYDLASRVNALIHEPELNAAASALMNAVEAAVIHEQHGPSWPGAHGISLYFPTSLDNWTAYQALQSSQLTYWDEFLHYHITGIPPCDLARIDRVVYAVQDLTVAFTPTVSGEAPLTFAWDFGDGATSDEPAPYHTYPDYGSYTVTLVVSNCGGLGHDAWTRTIHLVEGCEFPAAIWDVAYTVTDRLVAFDATVAGTEPIGYEWAFGDGHTSQAPDPVHLYGNYGTYTVTLTVSNCGGLASDTWQQAIRLRAVPCILLVDDDEDDPDVRASYTEALDYLGYGYDVWDVAALGNPTAADLEDYRMVLWFTGYPWGNTFTPQNEAAVAAYLDAGGNFFLSSEDYLYDFGLTPFGQNYLGITTYQNDVQRTDPVGNAGNPIGNGLGPYDLTPPPGWSGSLWTDDVTGPTAPFRWQGTGHNNSTNREGPSFRTVFLAWPLEGLAQLQARSEVLGAVIDWFGGCTTPPALVVSPGRLEATVVSGAAMTQTLWLTNTGLVPLTFALQESPRSAKAVAPQNVRGVEPEVEEAVRTLGRARLLVLLRDRPDLTPAAGIRDWGERGRFVQRRLEEVVRKHEALYRWLAEAGAQPRWLPAAGAIAATVDAALLDALPGRPEVLSISLNRTLSLGPASEGERAVPTTVEWNIARIRADEVWATLGITGTRATIGNVGTGVMYTHPALVRSYRGNLGGGLFDHNYNWFDFVNGQPVPYDDVGHSTFGMGIAVGDDGGENQIGVAPGARWIAAKACDAGLGCTLEDLLAAMQWMLAPSDLNGENPLPELRPQVVFNMWGGGMCDPTFQAAVQAWRAAGILPIFAIGGTGPSCGTVASPADLPESFCAGVTDSNDNIAPFSARGPSCYGRLKPEVAAPGVNVRSSYNDGGYATMSGTSWAAAHLAGTAALVLSADPELGPDQVVATITSTALCRTDLLCGGDPCANNVYGWGRIDAFEAVSLTLSHPSDALPWLREDPTGGTLAPGESLGVAVTFDAEGLEPGLYRGWLEVQSDDPVSPSIVLPVTLTVVAPCRPVSQTAFLWEPFVPFVGEPVTFTASATGTLPITFTWDLGDGSFAEGAAVVHPYALPGEVTVTLQARNACGEETVAHRLTVRRPVWTVYLPLILRAR